MATFLRTHPNGGLPVVSLLVETERYTIPGVVLSLVTGRCVSNSDVDNILTAFGAQTVLTSSLPPEGRFIVEGLASSFPQWSLARVMTLQEVHNLCRALMASDKVDVPHKMQASVVDQALSPLVRREPCDLWRAEAASLVQLIHKNGCFCAFAKPVTCRKYLEVISDPMDLQTLEASTFDDPASFLAALNKIWKNAMAYNIEKSQIFCSAKALETFVKRQIVIRFYRLAGHLKIKTEFPIAWEPHEAVRSNKRSFSSASTSKSTHPKKRQRKHKRRSSVVIETKDNKKLSLSAARVDQLRQLTQVDDLRSEENVSGFRYVNSKFSLTGPLRYYFQCRTSDKHNAVYTSVEFDKAYSAAQFGISKINEWIEAFDAHVGGSAAD